MIAQAKAKFIRVSPTKTNLVLELIRGKDVGTALVILAHVPKGSTTMVKKVLTSAISNAKQKGMKEEDLFISKFTADKGPMWKRFRAAGFGRATPILKRTTHLIVELDVKTK